MIFRSLSKYIKPALKLSEPISTHLLAKWMRSKLIENPPIDNAGKILQAAFYLQEIVDEKTFLIIPKSKKAAELMEMLKEYIQVMESIRFNRWLEQIKPQHFQKACSK